MSQTTSYADQKYFCHSECFYLSLWNGQYFHICRIWNVDCGRKKNSILKCCSQINSGCVFCLFWWLEPLKWHWQYFCILAFELELVLFAFSFAYSSLFFFVLHIFLIFQDNLQFYLSFRKNWGVGTKQVLT